jgi:uncharacterized membrane protein
LGVALDLASGFVECLLLVLSVEVARRGRVIYWGAVVGMVLVLYGRMADGILVAAVTIGSVRISVAALLAVTGLVLAALTVLADLMFEIVDEPGGAPNPSV